MTPREPVKGEPPDAAIERLAEAIHATICGGGLHYLSPCNQGWSRPILLALPSEIREATWAALAKSPCDYDGCGHDDDPHVSCNRCVSDAATRDALAAAAARVGALPAACRFTDCDCTVDMVCVHPEIVHVRLSAALAAIRGDSPAEPEEARNGNG